MHRIIGKEISECTKYSYRWVVFGRLGRELIFNCKARRRWENLVFRHCERSVAISFRRLSRL